MPGFSPRCLTPACSGLASLAPDARRWASPGRRLSFLIVSPLIGRISHAHGIVTAVVLATRRLVAPHLTSSRPGSRAAFSSAELSSVRHSGPTRSIGVSGQRFAPRTPSSVSRSAAYRFTHTGALPAVAVAVPFGPSRAYHRSAAALWISRQPQSPTENQLRIAEPKNHHGSVTVVAFSGSPSRFNTPPNPGMQRTRYARR